MPIHHLSELESRELIPGFHGKLLHTEGVTMAFWDIEAEAKLPAHQHPHEQSTTVLEGRFELTIAGESTVLEPGMVALIPGDVPHSGQALTACRLLDVFQPPRDEYR